MPRARQVIAFLHSPSLLRCCVCCRLHALTVVFVALSALVARGSDAPPGPYDHVEVAPAKTSIYVGTVSLAMPPFARQSAGYHARYAAKVFPYFFYNEQGTLFADVSEEMIQLLALGESIEFGGRAVRDDGLERRVEARATPADALSGKIKVRVFVSKGVELVFNTTYRFVNPEPAAGRSGAVTGGAPRSLARPL